jgi:hypothetical protein
MSVISPNVMRTVGEVLASHKITPQPGERLAETVARALQLSDSEVQRWLEALDQGFPPQEASLRAGISPERGNETLLAAVARAIGTAMGKAEKSMTATRQPEPLKDQGDKLES